MKSLKTIFENIEIAIANLKNGQLLLVSDNEDRENEGDIVAAAQFMTAEKMNFIISEAKGLVCAPMNAEFIKHYDLHPMVTKNTDNYGTKFTVSIDSTSVHTGISAIERSKTLTDLCDPSKTKDDFRRPGHIFPLLAEKDGVLFRNGHTEASVDLLKLAKLKEIAVICEVVAPNGDMLRGQELKDFAKKHRLALFSISDLIIYRLFKEQPFSLQYSLKLSDDEELSFYQSSGGYRVGLYMKGRGKTMNITSGIVKDLSAFRKMQNAVVLLEMKNPPNLALSDPNLREYFLASFLYKLEKELKFSSQALDNEGVSKTVVELTKEALHLEKK